MTLEWQTTDDPLPPFADASVATPRRRWTVYLFTVLLTVLLAGGTVLGWRIQEAKHIEEQLRIELAEVIRVETQAQAFGQKERLNDFMDAEADPEWKRRYSALFAPPGQRWWEPPDTLPVVESFTLNQSADYVELLVQWQDTPLRERRAYRILEGQWRRTPIRTLPNPGDYLESTSAHFRFRAPSPYFDEMEQGQPTLHYLEDLQRHLSTVWPADFINRSEITVQIYPQELHPFGGLGLAPNQETHTIYFNHPSLALFDTFPLSPDRQRALIMTTSATDLMLRERLGALWTRLEAEQPSNTYIGHMNPVMFQVQASVPVSARLYALTDEELKLMRNHDRTFLTERYYSPFASIPATFDSYNAYSASHTLLLEYLRLHHEILPNQLIVAIAERPDSRLEEHLTLLTGLSLLELDEAARTFALTSE